MALLTFLGAGSALAADEPLPLDGAFALPWRGLAVGDAVEATG